MYTEKQITTATCGEGRPESTQLFSMPYFTLEQINWALKAIEHSGLSGVPNNKIHFVFGRRSDLTGDPFYLSVSVEE